MAKNVHKPTIENEGVLNAFFTSFLVRCEMLTFLAANEAWGRLILGDFGYNDMTQRLSSDSAWGSVDMILVWSKMTGFELRVELY